MSQTNESNLLQQFMKSVGQIPGNAVNDVKGIASGLYNLPGQINNAVKSPQNALDFAKGIGTGLVNEGNALTGNPIQNVPLVGIQTPQQSVAQSAATIQHAQQHPVNTALDVANILSTVNALSPKNTELPPIQKPQNVRSMEAPPVSDVAANTYLKSYTIPKGLDVNSVNAAKYAIHDNPDISNLDGFLNNVEKVKRDVLANAGDSGVQVPVNDALANGLNQIKKIPQLADNPKKILGYQQELNAMIPAPLTKNTTYEVRDLAPTLPGETGNAVKGSFSTPQIGGTHPLDTYDAIKNIEQQGYAYRDAGTDAFGKISNPEYYKVGNAYIDTAKEIEAELDKAVGKTNIQAITSNPDILSQIGQFSSKVADRLANNVQNWSDLRALQKPYVDLNKIINYTNQAGHTAFANMSGGATRAISGGAGAAIGGSILGVPGAIGGGIAGSLLEPTFSAVGNKLLPPLARGVAGAINGVPSVAGSSATLLPAIGEAGMLANTQNKSNSPVQSNGTQSPQNQGPNESNKENNNNSNVHTGIISQPGRYAIQTPQQSGFLTTDQYTQQANALTQKIAQEKLYSPQQANIDQGTLDQLTTSWNNQKPIRDAGTSLNTAVGAMNGAVNVINSADPNLFNLNGSYDNLLKASDKRYSALAGTLQKLQQVTGINFSQAKTKDALIGMLDQAETLMQNDYNAQLQQFFGGNTLNANVGATQSNLPPIVNTQPTLPPIQRTNDASAIVGGSMPSVGLPAIQ